MKESETGNLLPPAVSLPGCEPGAGPAPRDGPRGGVGGVVRRWSNRRAEDCTRRTRFVSPPLTACLFVNPEGSRPKPSICVSPGGVIPMGGNVTIRCWHQGRGMRFLLYKDGDGNHLTYTDPASYVAEFPIPSARRKHGGSYICRYSHRTGPTRYSEPSDPVQIIVADPSLPRPSISLSPTGVTAPGADVTIRCQGQRRDVRFFLHKAGDLNPPRHMDPAGDGAEFRIPTVGRQHGGSYGCSYRPRSHSAQALRLCLPQPGVRHAGAGRHVLPQ
ncbi:osteoclast-associated immunoglobulin-like receptor isoform X4 [Lepidochelys kempii]|uniref:osteoclast-associated immunoglobulin-like receptor isoform X4 n=1 Tax=Lepidochelys kempii TaxID=8472 RepID=UPI003C7000C3